MTFKKVKILKCLNQIKDKIDIENGVEYKQVTVSNTGDIKLRGIKDWSNIWTKKQFFTKKWFFIYSRLWLHTWAFWIVPDSLDWAIITWDMPVFEINEEIVLKDFLILALNSHFYQKQVKWLNKWVAQSRIREKIFLNLYLYIPDISEQTSILEKYSIIKNNYDKFEKLNQENQNHIKFLKQAILQEAIEWKLTKTWRENNKDIEPASVLLEKIQAKRIELIKQKKLKKQKELEPILDDIIPFDIPESWEWVRLWDSWIFERWKSKHRPRNDLILFRDWKFPLIQTWDVSQSKNSDYKINTYSKKYNEYWLSQSRLWEKGTLCITIAANIAETGFLDIDACFPDSIVGFSSIDKIISQYIQYYFVVSKEKIEEFAPAMAQKNINLWVINDLLLPFPPLAEQKEIVKKVSELMKFCDELEQQVLDTKQNSENLMKAVLGEIFEK